MCLSNITTISKAESIQISLGAVLERKSREADVELQRLKKEYFEKEKTFEKETLRLQQTQQILKQEQTILKSIEQEVQKIVVERQILERSNTRIEGRIKDLSMKINQERTTHEELKTKHKKVVMKQIYFASRRKKVSVDINTNQVIASNNKGKIRKLGEIKSSQELYLEKLHQDILEMEQKWHDYETQLDVIKSHIAQMREIVISTDKESDKVRHDKVVIMSRWRTSVHKISKKDDLLIGLRGALKLQKLELKGIIAILGGVASENSATKEQHDHLVANCFRTERLCDQKNVQIKKLERLIEEDNIELEKSREFLARTNETLKSTNVKLRSCESELSAAQGKIEKQQSLHRQLEARVLLLTKVQEGTDKMTQSYLKAIHNAREKTKEIEEKIIEAQNNIASTSQEILELTGLLESQNLTINQLETKLKDVKKEMRSLMTNLAKAQSEIDKRQSAMDLKHQDKCELVETGKIASPLEAEVHRVQEEVEKVAKYCSIARQTWLNYQNECILLLNDSSQARSELTDLESKEIVLLEQKQKLEEKIARMCHSVNVELKRKIETLHGSVERLQKSYAEEKSRHTLSLKNVDDRRDFEIVKIQHALDDIQSVKNQVHQILKEIMNEKQETVQVSNYLEKVQEWFSEKDINEGIKVLKSENERLQIQLDKKAEDAKLLISSMENFINRRDDIVEKAATILLIKTDQHSKLQLMKSLVLKQILLLNKKGQKLTEEGHQIGNQLKSLETQAKSQSTILDNFTSEVELHKGNLHDLKLNIETLRMLRNKKVNNLMQNRTRARWYKAIQENCYQLRMKFSEGESEQEVNTLQSQKETLKEMLTRLGEQFPVLRKNILNVVFTYLN